MPSLNTPTVLSPAAQLEIRRLHAEAEAILAKPNVTRAEGKKVDGLLAKIATIKQTGVTDSQYHRNLAVALADELGIERPDFAKPDNPEQRAHQRLFEKFVRGVDDSTLTAEVRANDFLAGSQSVSWTSGPQGGVLVPQQFQKSVAEGLAAVDPLLDPNVCTVIQEPGLKLNPLELPGWDLSTVKAVQVAEAAQHASDAVPGVTQKLLNKFTYRLSLGASFEWEDDQAAFDSAIAAMGRAFGIGFARGIGADLVNGNGSSAPSGILNGLSSAYTTAANTIVLADILGVYFLVNKIYRSSPKCAWLMNDAAYKKLRLTAVDGNSRPLLDVTDDKLVLMGKPVFISPSLPAAGSTGSLCVFGDLSHFYVHVTSMFLRRRLQVPGYVENGKALFTGLMSADAVLHDPTGGVMPPVVAATLHV